MLKHYWGIIKVNFVEETLLPASRPYLRINKSIIRNKQLINRWLANPPLKSPQQNEANTPPWKHVKLQNKKTLSLLRKQDESNPQQTINAYIRNENRRWRSINVDRECESEPEWDSPIKI